MGLALVAWALHEDGSRLSAEELHINVVTSNVATICRAVAPLEEPHIGVEAAAMQVMLFQGHRARGHLNASERQGSRGESANRGGKYVCSLRC
mmetsp:Transcript_35904/g.83560  ORF Transcript_35904/g.83560 Transcript_35904/m.83560 type:complete len:93 (-) Transcript_35904:13-291(-)